MATPYSPLRPRGDTFNALERAEDRFGEEQDVARGLVRAATGMTASGLADEALRREVAGQEGWEARRDAALATQQEAAAYAPRISSLRDASGVGDVVDYLQGAAPGAAVTTLPSLGAALLTRGRWKPAAFAGAAVPSYMQSRGEIAGEQYADPTLSQASVEERDRAATYGGTAMAALDTVLPGSLANSALRKPARGFLNQMGRDAVTEGLTEAAQTGIQQFAHNTIDPTRGYDGWEMLDAGVAGAAGGAGLAGAMRAPSHAVNALLDRAQPAQNDAGGPPAAEGDGGPAPGPIDPNTPLLPAPTTLSDRAADLYETLSERFAPQAAEAYEKASDYVGDVMDRMNEAIKTAETPQDFIRSVFRPPVEEVAAADLVPDEADPGVLNAPDPAAALQDRDAQRQERAASFAEELLNDPATPAMIKDRIAGMGGDYTSQSNQAYLASTLIAVKGGQKVVDAVDSIVEFTKSLPGRAADAAKAAGNKLSRKNLQDINEADVAPLVALMAQRLGPTKAAEAPRLARQLVAAANRLSPDARITEETDRRLRNFSKVIDDEVLDLVTELSGSDALRNSIAKIRAIPSARSDVNQSNGQSFLESMLKQPLEPAVMGQLADFVDTMGLQLGSMSSERKNQVLGALASAFGSKREAQTVVEYYGNIRRDAFRREAEAGALADDRPSADAAPGEVVATLENPDGTVSYGAEFGSLTEQDAAEMTASYRDPNPARPFFRATDRAALRNARRAAPAGSRVATLREYVAQTGEAPQAVAARVRQDLRKRLADAENRDTATVQEAIASMEAIPEAERSEDFNALLSQLKARKTENRTDLPGLRKQMEAIEKASGVSFKEIADLSKRIRRAELADDAGVDNDDIANLPALRKQLAKLEDRYSKNAEKVLEKYAVVMRPKDETFANDELMAKFRGILDKLPNANVGTPAQRAEAKDKIAKIKKTAIKFNRKGGKPPITLSAESMAYASQARGSMEERFLDSLAAVLARPDIEGLVTPAPDTLISRQTGLTWGDISPEVVEDTRTERQKKAQREKDTTAAWAKQERMRLDIETRPKLMAALRDVQRRFLADRLGLTLAPDEAISLTDLIDRFPAAQRRAMRTEANEAAFQSALGWAKKLGQKKAQEQGRNYTDESRMRVLEEYLKEQVEDRFPMPEGDERASRRIAAEEQDAGMYADESGVGGAILDIEAELDMLEERIDALASVPWVARGYRVEHAKLMEEADRLADSVGTPEQRDARVPGSRVAESLEAKGDRLVESSVATNAADGASPRRAIAPKPAALEDPPLTDEERVNPHPTKGNLRAQAPTAANRGRAAPARNDRVILPRTGPYTAKDQAKSDKANKFIGRGAPGSSTAAYAEAWGDRANTGVYASDDVVFISVNGNRRGALTPPWPEIKKAMSAGATLITDAPADRARAFNTGERAVAGFLGSNGYAETAPGTWTPEQRGARVRRQSFVGAKADPEGAARAQEALDSGVAAKLVWAIHGWFRGPDGKLRKEIRSPVLRTRVRELAENLLDQRKGTAQPVAEATSMADLFDGVPGYENLLEPLRQYTLGLEDSAEVGARGMVGVVSDKVLHMSVDGAALQALINKVGMERLQQLAEDGSLDTTDTLASIEDMLREGMLPEIKSVAELESAVVDILESGMHHELQHVLQGVEGFENGGNPTMAIVAKYGNMDVLDKALADGDLPGALAEIERARSAMLSDIGPDADAEAVAYELYRNIVGEVEAHDVEARFKLSDEEAKRLRPELMGTNREFLRGVKVAVEAAKLAGMRQNRQTTVGDARKPPNAKDHAEMKKRLVEEIRRIRGNDVRVRFNRLIKQLGASGEFSMNADKTDRLIEVAVDAADPMGVAWHESLHDFFAMLDEDRTGRSIKRDLTDAANAPHVKKRLRELLAKHPKALKQIEKSPEERVAYMYQFWAAGELQLGPTGTGIFERIRQFFRDMLGVVGRDERALDLLTALHEGKFAEPSVVAEVLADMPRDRVANRLERVNPAITDTLRKVAAVAPDRLRAYQNEHLDRLADMFSSEQGELGFVQRRFQKDGEWTNKLASILEGSKATERRKALDNLQAMKAPSSKLERDLAKFFEDMHGYMLEAGVQTLDSKTKKWVPIRQVKNYFPRVFDRDAILKDREGFKNLLMQHGNMTAKAAENTINALTHGTGQLDLAENEHALGFTPYAQSVQDRQLTFIDASNAGDFAKYQVKDLADITTQYVKQAVHRAEYARLFGNRGEKISQLMIDSGITDKKELQDIEKIVQGLEGTLGYEMSSQTKELMSGVMTLQNLVILPVAIFSQMIDPVVLAARSGDVKDAASAYMTAVKRLAGKDVDGEDLAEMLGIISQDTVLDAMGVAYGTTHMSKRMRNINRVFFKYNGMQGWNNSMRIAATAAGERYILQNRNNKAVLAELGLEPSDIKTVSSARGVTPDKNNKVVLRERLDVSSPKVKEAMFRFVDQSVLRPSASNRPVWMSDPKFLLVAHLKQFTFAMHNVVLKRANQQLEDGNPKPWAILMLAMPTILAADMAKFALTGGPPQGWGAMDFIAHAVERSGLLGLGDFGAQAMKGVEQGRVPGEALLGPTAEHLMDLLRFLGGSPMVDGGDVLDRTVPGARFL